MIATQFFEQIESAQKPSDLFKDADSARSTYRRLARNVHPDANGGDSRAVSAFARLASMWDQYNGHTSSPSSATVYTTKRNSYFLGDLVARGDISNVYSVTYPRDGELQNGVLKMPRSPANNDLVINEISRLRTLKDNVSEEYQIYLPNAVDSFAHRDKTNGKTRRSLVLEDLEGFVSLRDVMDAYPQGISGRHVAWIARRLWIAMDIAHEAGVVHGAVFPEHVMIHPAMHGVVLVDWSYAQEKGEKLTSAVPSYLSDGWYGDNYDKPLDHRMDVRQGAFTLEGLLGEQGARPFRAFFNGCRVASAPTAGQLFEEFDDLLFRVYGKRSYVPFSMPQGWKRVI